MFAKIKITYNIIISIKLQSTTIEYSVGLKFNVFFSRFLDMTKEKREQLLWILILNIIIIIKY